MQINTKKSCVTSVLRPCIFHGRRTCINFSNTLLGIFHSFGLSDLHGDGRVHDVSNGPDLPSGFGFELTFRLRREPEETAPPTWPATLMQSLAKYVFQSG